MQCIVASHVSHAVVQSAGTIASVQQRQSLLLAATAALCIPCRIAKHLLLFPKLQLGSGRLKFGLCWVQGDSVYSQCDLCSYEDVELHGVLLAVKVCPLGSQQSA